MIHRKRRLAWIQQEEAADKKLRRFRNYGSLPACRAAAARAPVITLPHANRFLPIVHPRLPFYGISPSTPGAEAGYRRPVGAEQDQYIWV
jgi:hypothetical protein